MSELRKKAIAGLTALATGIGGASASLLVNFDFENHTAGPTIGSVGTPRSTSDGGDQFPFTSNASPTGVTVSTLGVGSGGGGNTSGIGSIVRSDTIAATSPGGNFLELHPFRIDDQGFLADLTPGGINDPDFWSFTITPQAGFMLSLDEFSIDVGAARGSTDTGTMAYRTHPFFRVNGGSWTSVNGDPTSSDSTGAFNAPQAFSGFSTKTDNLGTQAALQNLTSSDVVEIAIAMSDNTGRSLFSASSVNPAGFYVDNILVNGTVSVAIPEASEALILLLGLLGLTSFRRRS